MPRIGAPALVIAAAAVLALVVAGVGAFLFLPSAEIVVTPRPESIGPIALVVRADPDITSPNAAENLVPAQRLEVPVSASDTFPATDKRVEEEQATGEVVFQSYNSGAENTIAKGSIVSTEGGIAFADEGDGHAAEGGGDLRDADRDPAIVRVGRCRRGQGRNRGQRPDERDHGRAARRGPAR